MWWPLLSALKSHLDELINPPIPQPQVATIIVGDDGAIPAESTLILTRGPGSTTNWADPWAGVQTFYCQCWAFSDESSDAAYAGLAALEEVFIYALTRPIILAGYEVLPRITAIEPDGDAFRPSVGSRMTVEIEWRKLLF